MKKEGAAGEGGRRRRRRRRRLDTSELAAYMEERTDGRTRTPGRTRGEAVWPKQTHPPRPPWEERERAPRLKTDRASDVGRPMNEGESPARRRMGTTRRKGRRGGIVGR